MTVSPTAGGESGGAGGAGGARGARGRRLAGEAPPGVWGMDRALCAEFARLPISRVQHET